jgi:hypothetical protein
MSLIVSQDVLASQARTREYMREIPEVEKTLQELISVLEFIPEHPEPLNPEEVFPTNIARNKAFDGCHMESQMLRDLLENTRMIQLRVFRGFIAKGENTEEEEHRQLDRSDGFLVGFVPVITDIRNVPCAASNGYCNGFSFKIMRDGSFRGNISSIGGLLL